MHFDFFVNGLYVNHDATIAVFCIFIRVQCVACLTLIKAISSNTKKILTNYIVVFLEYRCGLGFSASF